MKSPLRSPFFWAFLAGIVTLTALRPLLRHVPEPPPVLATLPDWSLVDADGRPFGSRELHGQVYVVSFFFTQCRSICPAIMRGMARLAEGFDKNGVTGVRLVSISVDPEHDTPEVLKEYARGIGANPARWTLVTGDPARVRALVVDGFKTPMVRAATAPPEPIDIALAWSRARPKCPDSTGCVPSGRPSTPSASPAQSLCRDTLAPDGGNTRLRPCNAC